MSEELEVITPTETPKETESSVKAAKSIAIIAFIFVVSALVVALVSDGFLLSDAILGFIGACLAGALTFIAGFFLMLISIILIFGIYLLKEQGFWPLQWSTQAFHDVLKDHPITQYQISVLIGVRIALIVLCIIALILSIIACSMGNANRKKGYYIDRNNPTLGFGTFSLIFSILGLLAAMAVLLITSAL